MPEDYWRLTPYEVWIACEAHRENLRVKSILSREATWLTAALTGRAMSGKKLPRFDEFVHPPTREDLARRAEEISERAADLEDRREELEQQLNDLAAAGRI